MRQMIRVESIAGRKVLTGLPQVGECLVVAEDVEGFLHGFIVRYVATAEARLTVTRKGVRRRWRKVITPQKAHPTPHSGADSGTAGVWCAEPCD
jgi:hypothetical protein